MVEDGGRRAACAQHFLEQRVYPSSEDHDVRFFDESIIAEV
jgi:hypothetical protein